MLTLTSDGVVWPRGPRGEDEHSTLLLLCTIFYKHFLLHIPTSLILRLELSDDIRVVVVVAASL